MVSIPPFSPYPRISGATPFSDESNKTDPDITPIEAPLNANVWKVEISEGDEVTKEKVVTILEAMKLEIPVRADEDVVGWTVEKVLVKPNDVVQAGNPLVLLRKPK